jgi:hypothetical protein
MVYHSRQILEDRGQLPDIDPPAGASSVPISSKIQASHAGAGEACLALPARRAVSLHSLLPLYVQKISSLHLENSAKMI